MKEVHTEEEKEVIALLVQAAIQGCDLDYVKAWEELYQKETE